MLKEKNGKFTVLVKNKRHFLDNWHLIYLIILPRKL